ncbi:MAG TPA: hypothetical protein VMV46_07375 [Thermoanaerobaculia bacterium]|nr:hypothetical protein [Thermoanaerobaculia bacterium]
MSGRAGSTAAACLLAIGVAALAAQAPPADAGIDTLFPWRAPVALATPVDGASRLARLFLPAPVLVATRSDLSDLRLLDAGGREVPFVVDREAGLRRAVASLERAPAPMRAASQEQVIRDETIVLYCEAYQLSAPPDEWIAPGEGSSLVLRIETPRPRFVKRLQVEALDGALLLAGESLFRLPDPLRERVRFEIGAIAGGVRVTLEGEDGGWLEPTFAWERVTGLADAPADGTVDLPLDELSRSSEAGTTRWVVARPRGAVPLALVLDTSTPLLRRQVSVLDLGPEVARRELLAGEIWRVGPGEERLALAWPGASRPLGSQLELAVADGDSPPLADFGVALRLASPALLFAADAHAHTLVWGGGRARPARYDVGSLSPELPASGERAALALPLLDQAARVDATLGPPEPNPRFDPVSALEFAMAPGRTVDERRFSHRRALTASPTSTGLYRLTLSATDQAVLRPDLGDLRVVDSEGRQRPYVLVRDAGSERFAARFAASHPEGESVLRLALPSAPVTVRTVVLEIADPFFDRSYTVEATVDGASDPAVLARGRLRREQGDAGVIALELPARRVRTLALRIADGSDRPLRIERVELESPAPEVLFPAPAGRYVALLGDPDAEPPRYELETVRALVQAVDSQEVERGPLEANQALGLAARLRRGAGLERILLGLALAIAVIVLTTLTLRLASPAADAEHPPDRPTDDAP